MVKKRNTGFTLIETTIAVAIVGILSTAAVPAYQYYVAQAQVSESMEMMQGVKSKVEQSVIKSNSCIPTTGATEQGKYGVLTISGTVKSTATQNPNTALKTGCVLSYKVNADSVSKSTAGKLVVGDLFNNGSISKSSSTTVEDRLLPKEFKTLTEGAITATGAPSAGANANITVKASSGSGGSGSGGTTTTVNDQLGNNLGDKPTTDSSSGSSSTTTSGSSSAAGTPYGYLWRFNQNYMGGTMPVVEIGCVFQSSSQGKVKVVMPILGVPTTIDTVSTTEAYVASASFKSEAISQCNKAYTKMGISAFNAVVDVNPATVTNGNKPGVFFVKL